MLTAIAATAGAAPLTAAGAQPRASAPVLQVSHGTVRWSPVGLESAYRIAVSSGPRGVARRTIYATILRVPGHVQAYTPLLGGGGVAFVAVSSDGGRSWSAREARVGARPHRTVRHLLRWSARRRAQAHRRSRHRSAVVEVNGDTTATGPSGTGVAGVSVPAAVVPAGPPPAAPAPPPPPVEVPRPEPAPPPPAEPPAREPPPQVPPVTEPPVEEPPVTEPPEAPPITEPPVEEPPVTEPGAEEPPAVEPPGGEPATEEPLPGEPQLTETRPAHPLIIGTNDGSGWGPTAASKIIAGHITWDRFSTKAWSQGVTISASYGFKLLGIVNAVNDSTPLSAVEPSAWGAQVAAELAAHPSITLAEAGNESYLKGNVANPVQYGRMYMAAIRAMQSRGIKVPLLFNMTGDYPYGSWSAPTGWSEDAHGGGWLRDAVKGVPGLATAILANGVSIHPYGAVGENKHDDYGVSAAAAEEAVASQVLGSIPHFYITEFGYSLSACGRDLGACTAKEQAEKARAAYSVFLRDPNIYGIWWYQSHDDSTGHFGYMTNSNLKRPAFAVIASFAKLVGQ